MEIVMICRIMNLNGFKGTGVMFAHLTVVSSQVEVDALGGGSVSPAVTWGERHPHDAPAVTRGQPALLIVTPPAHGLLLLAPGHATLPGQAQDVGVAAQDGTVLHRREHTCSEKSARSPCSPVGPWGPAAGSRAL